MKTEYTTEEVQRIVQEETLRRERAILREVVIFTSTAGFAFLIGGAQMAFYGCLVTLITLIFIRIFSEIFARENEVKSDVREEQA